MSITVLMAVYSGDRADFFDQSLHSLSYQELKPNEVVLVINGHVGQEIIDIINKYENDLNIIRVQMPINEGLAVALNEGLKYCHYEYIARMDADDISKYERMSKQSEYLDKNTDIDVVGSWITEISERGNILRTITYPESNDKCYSFFKFRNPMAHPSVMFRRRFFQKAGNYPERSTVDQDSLLWMKGFLNNCKFANIQESYLYFRVNYSMYLRRNWKKAYIIFRNRICITRRLKFGLVGYLGAASLFFVYLTPIGLKKLLYRYFRK